MNIIIKRTCEMLVMAAVPRRSDEGSLWKGMGTGRGADVTSRKGLAEDLSILHLQHDEGVKCAARLRSLSCVIDCRTGAVKCLSLIFVLVFSLNSDERRRCFLSLSCRFSF